MERGGDLTRLTQQVTGRGWVLRASSPGTQTWAAGELGSVA